MIRVVADANVLISAALARSPAAPSALVLDAALNGRIELVSSPSLLAESCYGSASAGRSIRLRGGPSLQACSDNEARSASGNHR